MITYRKAAALISPGDVVFVLDDGGVTRYKVQKVLADSLKVDGGYLAFDLHGELWWLTERGVPRELWKRNG